jgi:hypothetical protein
MKKKETRSGRIGDLIRNIFDWREGYNITLFDGSYFHISKKIWGKVETICKIYPNEDRMILEEKSCESLAYEFRKYYEEDFLIFKKRLAIIKAYN